MCARPSVNSRPPPPTLAWRPPTFSQVQPHWQRRSRKPFPQHVCQFQQPLLVLWPTVTWRIFAAGQIRANIRVQNARQEEAFIQYRQAVLQSLQDVENALVAYQQEQVRRRSLGQAVDSGDGRFPWLSGSTAPVSWIF